MNINRFNAILDAYGASPEAWPAAEREAAQTLARSSITAARALAEARRLDDALRASPVADIEIPQARLDWMMTRIMAAATPRSLGIVDWIYATLTPARLWPSAAGLALAMVVGFAVGFGGFLPLDHDVDDGANGSVLDIALNESGQ